MMQLQYQLDSFSAAHRLVKGYKGPCAHLHGHTYQVQLCFDGTTTNEHDMMVDFAHIKRLCNEWVQDNLDHGTLICSLDNELLDFLKVNKQKHYVFPNKMNTTVEALSAIIYQELTRLIESDEAFSGIQLISVTTNESPRASATFTA